MLHVSVSGARAKAEVGEGGAERNNGEVPPVHGSVSATPSNRGGFRLVSFCEPMP